MKTLSKTEIEAIEELVNASDNMLVAFLSATPGKQLYDDMDRLNQAIMRLKAMLPIETTETKELK